MCLVILSPPWKNDKLGLVVRREGERDRDGEGETEREGGTEREGQRERKLIIKPIAIRAAIECSHA